MTETATPMVLQKLLKGNEAGSVGNGTIVQWVEEVRKHSK